VLGVVLGVLFLKMSFTSFCNCVAMTRVLVSKIEVEFPHKLLDFVGCSCFLTTFMNYYVIIKKNIQLKFEI
jgi:hypothetical protein